MVDPIPRGGVETRFRVAGCIEPLLISRIFRVLLQSETAPETAEREKEPMEGDTAKGEWTEVKKDRRNREKSRSKEPTVCSVRPRLSS